MPGMTLLIRPMERSQIEAAAFLIRQGMDSWPEPCQETPEQIAVRLLADGQRIWVAAGPGRMEGLVAWRPELQSASPRPAATGRDAHLASLYVAAGQAGGGLAGRLHRHALEQMRASGFGHVRLWTPECAGPARAFYARQGYKLSGRSILFAGLRRLEHVRSLRAE